MSGTSVHTIAEWIADARAAGATHLIVAVDEFSWEDYPVHVMPGESPRAKAAEYNRKSMQHVMEVYALHLDLESQLNERRSFHYEMPDSATPPQHG